MTQLKFRPQITVILCAALFSLSGCAMLKRQDSAAQRISGSELACMERVVYFESNRSSRDGMIAVGSVVMNCVHSAQFPNSICGVVGQNNQFAPGVMSKSMEHSGRPLATEAATALLRGERHPFVTRAMFFHQAGHSFPYDNMHYVLTAGGNAFYEKRKSNLVTQSSPPAPIEGITGGS